MSILKCQRLFTACTWLFVAQQSVCFSVSLRLHQVLNAITVHGTVEYHVTLVSISRFPGVDRNFLTLLLFLMSF